MERASRARAAMEKDFADAMVDEFDTFVPLCDGLPDPGDAHVLAAAMKTRAATIVTDNLKDFPEAILAKAGIEPRGTDAFIADTIELDPGRAVAAIRRMCERFQRPEKTPDLLLLDMEAAGLVETVDVLRPHVLSL
ncbi:PIN domain-containing protein [Qipengyuania sediminis]|uniref:PIN domain-containing protein n=1 Tax=Qipengyuania sediminis TaxID=1532023 RepID=UPI001F0DEBFC|nr:PIN domain-containing protein [Qipengyuania sediminis]